MLVPATQSTGTRFLQHFQHPDMRRPARAAAAQNQADTRPGGFGGRACGRQPKGQNERTDEPGKTRHGCSKRKKPCRGRAFR
jgi:hypothetical protein